MSQREDASGHEATTARSAPPLRIEGGAALGLAVAVYFAHGLKYPTSFADTHLGRIGRSRG